MRGQVVGATVRYKTKPVSNVMSTQNPGKIYLIAYVVEDLSKALSDWLKLVESNDITRAVLKDMQQAHEEWDGHDPVRVIA